MNKKLVFLIPLIFILVNIAHFNLYHQNIYYSHKSIGTTTLKQILYIRPSNWKLYKTTYSSTYHGFEQTAIITNMGIVPTFNTVALTKNASFLGFPFAFYFKTNNPPKTGSFLSPQSISAYSFYWFSFDLIIFIILTILSFFIYIKFRKTNN